MTRRLFEMANHTAEEEGLVYAPDSAAMAWMRKFAKMIAVSEREKCAALVEEMGINGYGTLAIAAAIRKGEECGVLPAINQHK
jgi:hypothetical protein